MKKGFVIIALVAMALTDASAQSSVKGVSVSKFQATYLESTPKFFPTPLVADIEVIKKDAPCVYEMTSDINIPVKASYEDGNAYVQKVSNFIKSRIEELKAQALFEFSDVEKADIIVAPTYSIVTVNKTELTTTVKVKVKGFPAKYVNFRPMEIKDISLVNTANGIDSKAETKVLESKKLTDNKIIK